MESAPAIAPPSDLESALAIEPPPAPVAPPQAVPAATAAVATPSPAARASDVAVATFARTIWDGVYAGFDASAADRDWAGWSRLYRKWARAVLEGKTTREAVKQATEFARRPNDKITRGESFCGAMKDLAAGHPLPNGARTTPDNEKPTFTPPRASAAEAEAAQRRFGSTSRQAPPPPAPADENGAERFVFPSTAAGILAYSARRQQPATDPEGPLSEAAARKVSRISAASAVGGDTR